MSTSGTTTIPAGAVYTNMYAIPTGVWNPTDDATLKTQCQEFMIYVKELTISPFADPTNTNGEYGIGWKMIEEQLLPDANDEIDSLLSPVYVTPLRKTKVNGGEYDRRLVKLAGIYIAWRLETRAYPGGGMPNDSPYAQQLKTMLDNEVALVLTDQHRLTGQRLKGRSRFVNPNIQPQPDYAPPGTAPASNE